MAMVENPSRRRLFRGNFAKQNPQLRLPWIKSEKHFVENCTQCAKCIDACETSIIRHDDSGFPSIDFSLDECTFCMACHDACEQPLFQELSERSDQAWVAAITLDERCLAANDIYCQSCQDVCDQSAISFQFTKGVIPQPALDSSACNFCGACISTCPQDSIEITPEKLEKEVING